MGNFDLTKGGAYGSMVNTPYGRIAVEHIVTPDRPFLASLAMHFDKFSSFDYACMFFERGKAQMELTNHKGGAVSIENFNVPETHSGFGHGSRALKTLCGLSDVYNISLWLSCEPKEEYPYPFPSLSGFYNRHGFEFVDQKSNIMTRKPRSLELAGVLDINSCF